MDGKKNPVVLAAVAHPDDIEFLFSGTLLLLQDAGCEIHFWNLADGCCGSLSHSREEIARIRAIEAGRSAAVMGANLHPPIFSDLEVYYDQPSLARVSSVVRDIRPQIVLTHAKDDYMEDHQNVCRLVTSAVFSRGMPNAKVIPPKEPWPFPARLYHAPPHGLHDGCEVIFEPDFLIDVSSKIETKRKMLGCHESQYGWLEDTQGMTSPEKDMMGFCRTMASWGEQMEYAEGWRHHSHLGFCTPEFDPLADLISSFRKPVTRHPNTKNHGSTTQ